MTSTKKNFGTRTRVCPPGTGNMYKILENNKNLENEFPVDFKFCSF